MRRDKEGGEVIPMPPHGRAPASVDPGLLPCRFCGAPTPWAVLSHNGARCFRCYDAYKAEPRIYPDVGDSKSDRRGWALALQARHKAGDRLTAAQIDAYKAALRRVDAEEDDVA
jgi:hypothetical protein